MPIYRITRFKVKLVTAGLACLWYLNSFAQVKSEITRYSTKDGLSHDGVLCITRDHEGFMWFGTYDGINRFDGHNFVTYKSRPGDNSKLRNNKVRDIIEDKAGYLWIQTFDYRVYRFDKATEQFMAIFEGPYQKLFSEEIVIKKMFADSVNGIWLLAKNRGMYYVQSDKGRKPVITRFASGASNAPLLSGNSIKFHYADSSGRMWVGTEAGLNLLQRSSSGAYRVVKFNGVNEQLLRGTMFTCGAHSGNVVYFGRADGQMLCYNTLQHQFKRVTIAPGFSINAICASSANTLYIATSGKGLIGFDVVSRRITPLHLEANAIYHTLYRDLSGNIWIEPDKYGVVRYNPSTGVYKHFNQARDYNDASRDYQVITDANGILWVSMKGGGFGYYNAHEDKIDYFFDEPGSPLQKFSNVLNCMYVDDTGVLWMSGKNGGINKVVLSANRFNFRQPVNRPHNRAENDVRAMMNDRLGRLWACTKDGLVHVYDHNTEVNIFGSHTNKLGFVYCIIQDRKGNVWLGTKGNGLYKAVPTDRLANTYALINYHHDANNVNSISNNMIYSVIEDHRGRIWVGTFGSGLNLYNVTNGKASFKNCITTFHHYPFIWAKSIRHLLEDSNGRIWVATSYGLVVFNPTESANGDYRFYGYQKTPGDVSSLGDNSVLYICEDNSRRIWLGTLGGGISKVITSNTDISHLRFQNITTADGLPNDVVLGITVDHHNVLWVTTAAGLARFDTRNGSIKSYDPFNNNEEGKFAEATCFTATNGILYFGCTNGYLSFNPNTIVGKVRSANMVFTNFQLYNKNVTPGTEKSPLQYTINETNAIKLKHDQNMLSIDYAVLDYRTVNKISYSYKLEGFDKTWQSVNNQRRATYTNIPPGSYKFKVKGTSEDLLKNVPERSVSIIIQPPFYLTYWAYLIYFIVAVLILLLAQHIISTLIRLRNKVVVEQKLTEVKLAFFTNISHELRTPLTLIAGPLEELSVTEHLSEKGRAYFKIINSNVNRMIRFTNQLLDFRKVQNGKIKLRVTETNLAALIAEVGNCFQVTAAHKQIDFEISLPNHNFFAWIDAEKIEIVLYNLLSNAFKFSPVGKKIKIELKAAVDPLLMEIRVIDQGKGVPASHLEDIFEIYHEELPNKELHLKGTGIGLALARKLAQSHRGKLWAELNESGGMTFVLQLKTGYEHFLPTELTVPDQPAGINEISLDDRLMTDILQSGPPVDKQPLMVLIVEDNADLRSFLELKLNDYYQIITAVDGAEGLKIARSAYPDLIISDVVMPNMDGIQMLDAIKHDQTISHIPVIMLTAKASFESRINALRYGADVYLTKPFQNELLMVSIDNLLQSRKRLFEYFTINAAERKIRFGDDIPDPVTTSKDEDFLAEVIRVVDEKLGDQNFNIDEVASMLGMGRTTFYKKLKSLSSLSPVEFVRELRLKRSKELLESGKHTVSEVAYIAGFNTLAYFSTCFKEKYEISPSAYLKKSRA